MIESELVAETCETVCSDRDAAVNIEWNASETDEARDTGEVKSSDDVMSADVSLPRQNVTETDAPSRLDQLEQTTKLDNSVIKAECHDPSTADKPPADTGSAREVLQPTDMKLNHLQDDDIDVIDLSTVTVQCNIINSSRHVNVCFEVSLF